MRSTTLRVVFTIVVLLLSFLVSLDHEQKRVRALKLKVIDVPAELVDANRQGGIVYVNSIVKASLTIRAGKLTDVQVAAEGFQTDSYKSAARAVVAEVLKTQRLELHPAPDNSLATDYKKAVLLAIEAALTNAPMPAADARPPRTIPPKLFLIAFFAGLFSIGTQVAARIAASEGAQGMVRVLGGIGDFAFMIGTMFSGLAILINLSR